MTEHETLRHCSQCKVRIPRSSHRKTTDLCYFCSCRRNGLRLGGSNRKKVVAQKICEVCGWIKPAHYESKQCIRCLGKLVCKVIIKK